MGTPGLSQTRFEARDFWPSAGGDDDHPSPGPRTSDDDFSHIFDHAIYFMIYNIEWSIKTYQDDN